jgi:hypothetical protein
MSAMSGTAPNEVRRFVHAFSEGWRAPHPHAWDDLLADDLVLRQPLLPHRHGRAALAEEYARILQLLPDLRGKGTGWTASGPDGDATVVLQIELTATLGRRQIVLPLVDVCRLRRGLLHERTSYLDPTPAVAALLRTPSAWTRWWRSGVGPFSSRRHLTAVRAPSMFRQPSPWVDSRSGFPPGPPPGSLPPSTDWTGPPTPPCGTWSPSTALGPVRSAPAPCWRHRSNGNAGRRSDSRSTSPTRSPACAIRSRPAAASSAF